MVRGLGSGEVGRGGALLLPASGGLPSPPPLPSEADAVAAGGEEFVLGEVGEGRAVDGDPPGVGGVQAADEVEEGGLA